MSKHAYSSAQKVVVWLGVASGNSAMGNYAPAPIFSVCLLS